MVIKIKDLWPRKLTLIFDILFWHNFSMICCSLIDNSLTDVFMSCFMCQRIWITGTGKSFSVARDWAETCSESNLKALNLNCSKIFHFIIEAQVLNEVIVVWTWLYCKVMYGIRNLCLSRSVINWNWMRIPYFSVWLSLFQIEVA